MKSVQRDATAWLRKAYESVVTFQYGKATLCSNIHQKAFMEVSMEDRELLEYAAKAAGIKLQWHNFSFDPSIWDGGLSDTVWNPLTDDGDALRLAVKLHINIKFGYCQDDAPIVICDDGFGTQTSTMNWPNSNEATRRAIVCVAAEIGKSL